MMTRGKWSTFGLDVIALIFIPSYLVHAHIVTDTVLAPVKALVDSTQILSIYISLLILGSILSIERTFLLTRIGQYIVPVLAASCASVVVGTICGVAIGLAWRDALFFVVFPVMAGGISAGALPLSAGYGGASGLATGPLLAQLLPSVIVGNFVAMVLASLFSVVEERLRGLPASASSDTDKSLHQGEIPAASGASLPVKTTMTSYASAALSIAAFTVASWLASHLLDVSLPLASIVLAVLLHWLNIPSGLMRSRIVTVYRFGIAALTYPILVLVGLLYTPWQTLIAGFAPARLLIIVATVTTLGIVGSIVSRRVALSGIDGGLVSLTRAAMGGTGDVIILSAARRLDLMPFAQIATRAGGVATVFIALAAAHYLGIVPR
jgi:Na+/citrate or Na+/malate symporter